MLLASLLLAAQALRPDVVIVVIDDVAASDVEDLSRRGWTPKLDALAARGVTFSRAYAHAKCHPTRDSLLFSRWLGLDRGDACSAPSSEAFTPAEFSLPRMMAGAGYSTVQVGKWHVGAPSRGPWEMGPELAGFGYARCCVPVGPTCNVPGTGQQRLDDGVYSVFVGDNTIACRDAFLDWWATTSAPRFAMVNFGAAHSPFSYPDASLLPAGWPPCSPLSCTNRREYEAEIVGVDTALGQIIDVVGTSAYVIFLGDNGTPGLVPGQPLSVTDATRANQDPTRVKLTTYEDGVRIPLIVAGPKVVPGESAALVHVVDILPTVARIAGLSPAPDSIVHGRSFAAALIGLPGPRKDVFAWEPAPNLDRAVIERRWKLLTRGDGVEELYDLQNDPLELSPLPATGPDADRLRARRAEIEAGGS